MSKDEMIKDLTKTMCEFETPCTECEFNTNAYRCSYKAYAEQVYNANYRKVGDDEIVISKRQYKQLKKYNRDRKRLRLKWQQAKQDLDDIYNAGYRKVGEDEIVESMKTYEISREETAREILQDIMTRISSFEVNGLKIKSVDLNIEYIKTLANKYGIELE